LTTTERLRPTGGVIGLVKVARRGNYDRRTTGKRSRGDGKDMMKETTEKMSNLFLLRDASSDKLRGVVERDVKKQKIEALAEEERRLGRQYILISWSEA
jgi:hypothetical protein